MQPRLTAVHTAPRIDRRLGNRYMVEPFLLSVELEGDVLSVHWCGGGPTEFDVAAPRAPRRG